MNEKEFFADISLISDIANDQDQIIIDISGNGSYQEWLTFTRLVEEGVCYMFMVDGDDLEGTQWQYESGNFSSILSAIQAAFVYLAITPIEERMG